MPPAGVARLARAATPVDPWAADWRQPLLLAIGGQPGLAPVRGSRAHAIRQCHVLTALDEVQGHRQNRRSGHAAMMERDHVSWPATGNCGRTPIRRWADAVDTEGGQDLFGDVQPLVFAELCSDSEVPP